MLQMFEDDSNSEFKNRNFTSCKAKEICCSKFKNHPFDGAHLP